MGQKTLVWALVGFAVVGAFGWRSLRPKAASPKEEVRTNGPKLRMVELGSDECASCKAMMPVLEELRKSHGDRLRVDFIDVWKFPKKAKPYGVRVIPTQVFFGPDGKELARHEGFFPVKGIRNRWRELGFPLSSKGGASKVDVSTEDGAKGEGRKAEKGQGGK